MVLIEAGAAGLSAGAPLAKEGRRVLVVDTARSCRGRATESPDEGLRINTGGRLLADPGSWVTSMFPSVGEELSGEALHEVKVAMPCRPWVILNEISEEEITEAPCVVSTLPARHVLNMVPEPIGPDPFAFENLHSRIERHLYGPLTVRPAIDLVQSGTLPGQDTSGSWSS